jgi:hypothetical protein
MVAKAERLIIMGQFQSQGAVAFILTEKMDHSVEIT